MASVQGTMVPQLVQEVVPSDQDACQPSYLRDIRDTQRSVSLSGGYEMNWVQCYTLYRKDCESWVFEEDANEILKLIQYDIDFAATEAKKIKDPELASEYRQEAATLAAELEKIKTWLPTAKHKDVVSLELYEVTAFELPLRFRDYYLY